MQFNRITGLIATTAGVCKAFSCIPESFWGNIAQQSDREI